MLVPTTFLFLDSVSSGAYNFIESMLFKWNKNTSTVQAKVHNGALERIVPEEAEAVLATIMMRNIVSNKPSLSLKKVEQ